MRQVTALTTALSESSAKEDGVVGLNDLLLFSGSCSSGNELIKGDVNKRF